MQKPIILFILLFSSILTACGSDPVKLVKDGVLPFDPSTTVINAFEGSKFFSKIEWSVQEDVQHRKFVLSTATVSNNTINNNNNEAARVKRRERTGSIIYKQAFYLGVDGKSFTLGPGQIVVNDESGKECVRTRIFNSGELVIHVVYPRKNFFSSAYCGNAMLPYL